MMQKSFDYPYSMPGLRACKAAEFQGGQEVHWDYFDRLQKAHLTECRNIVETEVLLDCARELDLNMQKFQQDLLEEKTRQSVQKDILRAQEFGIHAVPTILINQEKRISGAIPYEQLKQTLEQFI